MYPGKSRVLSPPIDAKPLGEALAKPGSAILPRGARPLPGDLAIWVFIFAELLVFGVLFVVYAFARRQHIALFDAEQLLLDRNLGLYNTLLLITSSFSAAHAVQLAQAGRMRQCIRYLLLTIALGLAFLVLKVHEYKLDAEAGISLSRNLFDMFYLCLTGFHFLHVVMGLVILSAVTWKASRGAYSRSSMTGIETGVSYWHMVDLVWIVLFALIYVLH